MTIIPNFRAYVDDKMYDVIELARDRLTLSRPFKSKYIFSVNSKVDNKTIIMQGSGMKDVKGKEIFVNDIVKTKDKDVGIVKFKDGCFIVIFKNYITEYLAMWELECEVIGNIHENKKLFEKIINENNKHIEKESNSLKRNKKKRVKKITLKQTI